MKKSLLSVFIFFSPCSFGQKYSIGVSGGYGFGIHRDVLGNNSSSIYASGGLASSSSPETVKASFGEGFKINLHFDYSIGKKIRIGIDGTYHKGREYSVRQSGESHSHSGGNSSENFYSDLSMWNRVSQYQMVPNLKYQFGKETKPYV